MKNLHKITNEIVLTEELRIYILYHQNVVHNKVRIFRDGRDPQYYSSGLLYWRTPTNYKGLAYKQILGHRKSNAIDWSRVEIV